MTCHIMRHEPFPRYAERASMDEQDHASAHSPVETTRRGPRSISLNELQGCVSIVTVVHECRLGSHGKSPHCRRSSGHDVRGQISVANAPVAPLIPRIPRAYEL